MRHVSCISFLFLCAVSSWSLAPTPLVFNTNGIASDAATQQSYWDELLKYKLWGRDYLAFVGQDVQLTEQAGWTGTLHNFTMNNTNHTVLGTVVVGGDIGNGDGNDVFDGGYVRVGGNIAVSSNGRNSTYFRQQTCVHGSVINGYGVFSQTPDQGDAICPAGFPALEDKLDIPNYLGSYGVATANKDGGTLVIDGRPASGETLKDIYLDKIDLQNAATLLIHQNQSSGITRVFVKNMSLSSTQWNIGVTYDSVSMIADTDYRGSLLIYTESSLSIPAGTRRMQGTYISKGDIFIQQGLSLAGQMLGGSVSVNAGFNAANFHYVPFDPPQLDPTALASGIFYEGVAGNQQVKIQLDRDAVVDVTFKAWFLTPGTAGYTTSADLVPGYPNSLANAVSITIPKGSRVPSVPLSVQIEDDGFDEGTENFQIVIDDLEGAVLPNNLFTDTLDLSIVDNDLLKAPVARDTLFNLAENSAVATVVGTAPASDANVGAVLTYSILSGNTSSVFSMGANGVIQVANTAALNFEGSPNNWVLEVLVTDDSGLKDTSLVTIQLTNVNESPATLSLSAATIAENLSVGTLIGNLTATDPDASSTFTYALVSGTGSTGNLSFAIVGNKLQSNVVFNYEAQNSYSVRIRVTDNGGLFYEKVFTVTISNVNEAPAAPTLSNNTVPENQPLGTLVGNLSATDSDAGSTLTYALVSGTGSTDNAKFTLVGNALSTNAVFDYETRNTYSVRVRATDNGGMSTEDVLTIWVTNVNEAPTDLILTGNTVDENRPVGTSVGTFSAVDPDASPSFTYSLVNGVGSTDNAQFSIVGNVLQTNASFDFEMQSSYSIRVRVSDGSLNVEKAFSITVLNVNEAPVGLAKAYDAIEDLQLQVSASTGVLNGATDIENEALTAVLETSAAWGTVTLHADGSFEYMPTADFFGADEFTFRIQDAGGAISETIKARIQVAAVNDMPLLSPVEFTLPENSLSGTLVGTVVGVDKDGEGLSYTLVNGDGFLVSITGVITVASGAQLDFETNPEYTLTVMATDDVGGTVQASVRILLSDVREASQVVIVSAQTTDSSWSYPDTIWINQTQVQVDWTTDGVANSSQETLVDNQINKVVKQYIGAGSDTFGADTLVVVVNSIKPEIKFELPPVRQEPVPGVTVVDSIDPADTVVYINDSEKEIKVTITAVDGTLKQVVISETIKPELTDGLNTITYTYTDVFGNTVTETVTVFLDKTPPVVKITTPADGYRTENVVETVEWTVDGAPMHVLNLQSLDAGTNRVIRSFRDKAGNEGSDTVWVYLIKGKSIVMELEKPVLVMDNETIEKFYAVRPPEDEELYSISILNNQTGLEEKTLYGKGAATHLGDNGEPYPGITGSHLGPTLRVRVRLPEIGGMDQTGAVRGGLLGGLVESDGRIAISAGAGESRVMVSSVDEYVSKHCLAGAFDNLSGTDLLNSPLYKSTVSLQVQVYDVTGQFVDQMSVVQDISKAEYLDDAGVLTMYFEIKPTREHGLQSITGRKYGDGAFIFQAKVKASSTRLCDMPDGVKGQKMVNKENVLNKFGYKRD